jgi:Na+/H+ antiporter NhaD/arsenite permease-like protein
LKDPVLWVLALLIGVQGCLHPRAFIPAVQSIHLPTLMVLGGLMMLTQGIQQSQTLPWIGRHILNHLQQERVLALFMIVISVLLSTLLTNDITLFVVIPLVLAVRQQAHLPWRSFVVFITLAVNVGSLLSPIGNPQNIFLWQRSHEPFLQFFGLMAPWGLILLVGLLLLTWWRFPAQAVTVHLEDPSALPDRRMFWISVWLYFPFLILVDEGYPWLACLLTMGLGAVYRTLWRTLDWGLLLTFSLFFVAVSQFSSFVTPLTLMGTHPSPLRTLFVSALLSQVMSNVPATLFLESAGGSMRALAYGVNAGGFGLFIGSLANLIALRMAQDPMVWKEFHRYSFPFLGFSLLTAAVLLQWT